VKRISIEQAKAGQILAEKVARQDGVLLANAGSEITDGLLRMLARLNVDTVVIEEDEGRSEEEIRAQHGEDLERLNRAFRRVNGNAVLTALKKTLAFLSQEEMEKAVFALKESQKDALEREAAAPPPAPAPAGEAPAPEDPPPPGGPAPRRGSSPKSPGKSPA
jgi:hypothetical protein